MIGLLVPPDRWTCPSCRVTEVADAQSIEETGQLLRRAQRSHARRHLHERRGWISLSDLLAEFSPGSHGDGWTWEDETRDLLTVPCLCPSQPPHRFVRCDTPGHYQLMLEDHLRAVGFIEQPICLGSDGRVWDGHHRVVAAIRLGIDRIPVETPNATTG